jgi:hypothetical protein
MDLIKRINELNHLSYVLYDDHCRAEMCLLQQEERALAVTPLGELEVFWIMVAGVVYSITHGRYPIRHLELLKQAKLEKSIPHLAMIKKYPAIYAYLQNWEELRKLCIAFLENPGAASSKILDTHGYHL